MQQKHDNVFERQIDKCNGSLNSEVVPEMGVAFMGDATAKWRWRLIKNDEATSILLN